MVEARGVEPLSENAASKEPTYLVASLPASGLYERTRGNLYPNVRHSR